MTAKFCSQQRTAFRLVWKKLAPSATGPPFARVPPQTLKEGNPVRGLIPSLSHLPQILLVSLLVLSTHLLWGQGESPVEEIPVQLFDAPSQLATLSEAQTHLHFTYRGLPLRFEQNQDQTEPWMRFSRHHNMGDYRLPTKTKAVLNQATGTAELRGEEKYFIGSAPSKGLTFAPTYDKVHHETIYRVDELEYYGHHIPWVGSLIVRISQQARVHPHVTRILKVIRPQL
jgi:hypothetical protein